MKLLELDAQFLANAKGPMVHRVGDRLEGAQGVLFQCPKCAVGKRRAKGGGFQGAHYIRVFFSNPRGAPVAPADVDDNPRWEMSGSSLADLTLSRSIDLSHDKEGKPQEGCQWHGFVKNGDAA